MRDVTEMVSPMARMRADGELSSSMRIKLQFCCSFNRYAASSLHGPYPARESDRELAIAGA